MPDNLSRPDRSALDRLAFSQAGYFSAGQAAEFGFSAQLLAHHARSGRFERVRRGLYRLRDYPVSPHEEIHAAWLPMRDCAVVSHESALELHGLSDVMPDRVHLTVSRADRGARVPPGVALHTTATLPAGVDVARRNGIALTSPGRSIVDAAAGGTAPEQIEAAIRRALREGMTTAGQLRRLAAQKDQRVTELVERSIAVEPGGTRGTRVPKPFAAHWISASRTRPPRPGSRSCAFARWLRSTASSRVSSRSRPGAGCSRGRSRSTSGWPAPPARRRTSISDDSTTRKQPLRTSSPSKRSTSATSSPSPSGARQPSTTPPISPQCATACKPSSPAGSSRRFRSMSPSPIQFGGSLIAWPVPIFSRSPASSGSRCQGSRSNSTSPRRCTPTRPPYGRDEGRSTPSMVVDLFTRTGGRVRQRLPRAPLAALGSLPTAIPPPPSDWSSPYTKLAETVGLPPELERGHREAAELLDPVLSGLGPEIWDPRASAWSSSPAPAAGRPQITASADGITIGELQNVASDVQPIRVRTLHLPIVNRGERAAIDVRAKATSSGHGPLTARAPRTLEAGESSTVELTLAAPVDQTIAAGDRFDIDLDYGSVSEHGWHLSFTASYDGIRWRVEGADEAPSR